MPESPTRQHGCPGAHDQGVDERGGHVRIGGVVEVLQPLGAGKTASRTSGPPGHRIPARAARPGSPFSRPAGGLPRRRPRRSRMVGSRKIQQAWSIAASAAVSVSASRVAAWAITRLLPWHGCQQLVVGGQRRRRALVWRQRGPPGRQGDGRRARGPRSHRRPSRLAACLRASAATTSGEQLPRRQRRGHPRRSPGMRASADAAAAPRSAPSSRRRRHAGPAPRPRTPSARW